MNLNKNGKVFKSKFIGAGPSSFEKKISSSRGLTKVEKYCSTVLSWWLQEYLTWRLQNANQLSANPIAFS